jgi:hypothetical protein
MPIALFVALAGSLAIHAAALFGTDIELFGGGQEAEPVPLRAELRPPPPASEPVALPSPPAQASPPPAARRAKPPRHASAGKLPAVAPKIEEPAMEIAPEMPSTAAAAAPDAAAEPPRPVLPASGSIRFAIFKESLGLQIGRAEHSWEFAGDGSYRLTGTTETSGLVALFKPVRMEVESRGRMVAGGLQPERYTTLKNGRDANENAEFDWASREVRLSRDGSVRQIAPGAQDILSLNYQFAYLGRLAEGVSIGVVTGRKYVRYAVDSLGEEEIETPAGRFRTLHLRAMTDRTTEVWIALDHGGLPVKIRFTDNKGESYVQVATELGSR